MEGGDLLGAEALNVEGGARHEMAHLFHGLRRADEAARAAAHHVLLAAARVDVARGMAAADGADLRQLVGHRVLRALLEDDTQNLRDHVAGALEYHRVADPHVLARDLVLVVQRGVAHHDAADRHGF